MSRNRLLNLRRNERRLFPLAMLVLPYIGIAAWIAVGRVWGERLPAIVWLPITWALIAGLQNHLQILLHEGAHGQIHPNPRVNDFLTNVFCAIPFGGLLHHYRHFHLLHHVHLLDPERDPEVEFYREQGWDFSAWTWKKRLRLGFLDLSGYHFWQFFVSYNRYLVGEVRGGRLRGLGRDEQAATALVALAAIAIAGFGHGRELLWYWLFPQPTFLFFFLKLQGYGEHSRREGTIENCTRSPRIGWLGRIFIYPLHSNYHREHHLYPTVPWYRLQRLSRALATSPPGG